MSESNFSKELIDFALKNLKTPYTNSINTFLNLMAKKDPSLREFTSRSQIELPLIFTN